jgi:hypothetical protein
MAFILEVGISYFSSLLIQVVPLPQRRRITTSGSRARARNEAAKLFSCVISEKILSH